MMCVRRELEERGRERVVGEDRQGSICIKKEGKEEGDDAGSNERGR